MQYCFYHCLQGNDTTPSINFNVISFNNKRLHSYQITVYLNDTAKNVTLNYLGQQ